MKRTQHYLNEIAKRTNILYDLSDDELKLLKATFVSIYQDIAEVCNKYGLIYMAAGGTTIGAVRHKGFIPWDDDFDLMMPREDYHKLIEVFDDELGDKYKFSSPEYDNGDSQTLYAQVYKKGTSLRSLDTRDTAYTGIHIDIYPIDMMPDNAFLRAIKCRALDLLRILAISVTMYQSKNELYDSAFKATFSDRVYLYIRKSIGFFCSIMSRSWWYRLHSKLAQSTKNSKWCTLPTCDLAIKELQPASVFFPPREATFESVKVFIPNDVDAYLTQLYGDYMQLPPVEKRERHFYIEKPKFG